MQPTPPPDLGALAEKPGNVTQVRFPSQKSEPNHGTVTRYNRPHECRCELCTEAKQRSDTSNLQLRSNRDLLAAATASAHPMPFRV